MLLVLVFFAAVVVVGSFSFSFSSSSSSFLSSGLSPPSDRSPPLALPLPFTRFLFLLLVFVGDDDDSGIGGDISFLFRVVFFPSSSISTAESAAEKSALGVVPLLLPRLRFGEGEGIIYIILV